MYCIYGREYMRRSGRLLLLPLHKHIYLKRIWRMCQRGNCPWHLVILKSKSIYADNIFKETADIETAGWGQANRRQKLGLVWRIRKNISQIIKDYFYLPFFLLIILWIIVTPVQCWWCGGVCFLASQIRILPSISKRSKKNPWFLLFLTCYLWRWRCECTMKKFYAKKIDENFIFCWYHSSYWRK